MRVHPIAGGFVAHAPAKVNLFFEILAKRPDGFHDIETLICPLNLYDTLSFADDPAGAITLQADWSAGLRASDPAGRSSLGDLPAGRENIVMRTVERLRERAGVTRGASLRLVKRIPSAAGLGGGSSDAAAALLLANAGWNLNWPRQRLLDVAAELGSDVPFFLAGGAAVCRGRGEIIEPAAGLARLDLVVVRPPAGLNTAAVYGACRAPAQPRSVAPLLGALRAGDLRELGRWLYNGLEAAAASLCGWIGRLQREFRGLGLLAQQMSGSGSSYFGVCRNATHARQMASRLQSRGLGRAYALAIC